MPKSKVRKRDNKKKKKRPKRVMLFPPYQTVLMPEQMHKSNVYNAPEFFGLDIPMYDQLPRQLLVGLIGPRDERQVELLQQLYQARNELLGESKGVELIE